MYDTNGNPTRTITEPLVDGGQFAPQSSGNGAGNVYINAQVAVQRERPVSGAVRHRGRGERLRAAGLSVPAVPHAALGADTGSRCWSRRRSTLSATTMCGTPTCAWRATFKIRGGELAAGRRPVQREPRHVSVRDLVQHHLRRRLHRFGRCAQSHGPRRRRDESLHDPRRRRTVADRERRNCRHAARHGPRIRRHHRTRASLRLV